MPARATSGWAARTRWPVAVALVIVALVAARGRRSAAIRRTDAIAHARSSVMGRMSRAGADSPGGGVLPCQGRLVDGWQLEPEHPLLASGPDAEEAVGVAALEARSELRLP